ncbi:MAG: transporter substrate-binding domain-containing protein [Rhodobacteraceae bacterium]|jgi:polar amino acid transport system substrate-binding protein|nr:transporter substrate-binding domain-containing protein [Paracoccaceae bacterium]
MNLTFRILPAAAVAVAAALAASDARAQELCSVYTIVSGDTLSQIARRAGVPGGYQTLFSLNSDTIRNPNVIEVGGQLRIPCPDGALPGATAAAAAEATPTAPAEAVAPPEALPAMRFLTAGFYAPFTDEGLPEGGMFTELVKTAVRTGNPDQAFNVTFVNDWGPHLTVLLPSGAFDMGFPWYKPDCTKVENLQPANALRCTDYNHSDPFFEAAVGYYAMKGSDFARVATYPELLGARLCRPRGWFTFDLEANRLVEPNITLLVAPTQVACWDALKAGEVDVVTFDALPAEADLIKLGLLDTVVEIPQLTSVETLHVFAPKSNPNGEAFLETINRGLAELRSSGQWMEIVSRHLGAQEAAKVSATD